jgi:DNA-binding HxlR family transcriptional regulator
VATIASFPPSRPVEPWIRDASDLMSILSNPARVQILLALRDGPLSCQEIINRMAFNAPTFIPKHFQTLKAASLISTVHAKSVPLGTYTLEPRGEKLLPILDIDGGVSW